MTKQPLFLASAPSAEVPNGPYSQAQPPVGPCPSGAELGDRNRGVTGITIFTSFPLDPPPQFQDNVAHPFQDDSNNTRPNYIRQSLRAFVDVQEAFSLVQRPAILTFQSVILTSEALRPKFTKKMSRTSLDLSDSASILSQRTVVSTSSAASDGDDAVPEVAEQSHDKIQMLDVWQFLLSSHASNLRRFETSDFEPAGTAVNGAEGTSYRVVRNTLSRGRREDGSKWIVAIKHLKHREETPRSSKHVSGLEEAGHAAYDERIETVLRELRILAHKPVQDNSYVAQTIGYGTEQIGSRSSLYIVAAFASGGTLQDYMRTKAQGSITFQQKAELCYDIIKGLSGLHACGIAHGDVKLKNTLVFCYGDHIEAKLSDFGNSIFDDTSHYFGTAMYNAPELRQKDIRGVRSRNDWYKCDIFSYGLSVWEILQDGKPFVDAALLEGPIQWLNELPKDDLLLMALQKLEAMDVDCSSLHRIMRLVLEGILQETPEDRMNSAAIVDIFDADRLFHDSKRITSLSLVDASEIPPLEPWSLNRTDNLAKTVPSDIQKDFVALLESRISIHPPVESTRATSFDLAMCYLGGFGVKADPQRSCGLLLSASRQKDYRASAVCHRLHESFGIPMAPCAPEDQSILLIEEDLRQAPSEAYYSWRIRRHEKAAQRALIDSMVDVFSHETLVAKKIAMDDFDALEGIFRENISDVSSLRAVSPGITNDFPTSLVHLMARLGHLRPFRFLIQIGVSVNTMDGEDGSLLISACRGGHAPVIEYLMANGATSTKRQKNGITPFHWMMMFEDSDIVPVMDSVKEDTPGLMSSMVDKAIELPNHFLSLEGSPLHFAVSVRNLELTKAFLNAGVRFYKHIWEEGCSPLDLAVANHCPEIADLLLSSNLTLFQQTPLLYIGNINPFKLLLMHASVRLDMLEKTVDRVIRSWFQDVNALDSSGFTPLAEALQRTPCDLDMHVFETLIDRGGQVNLEVTRLMDWLLSRRDEHPAQILALLLNKGALKADVELLCRAASIGFGAIVDVVLKAGINPNELRSDGLSALLCAVQFSGNAHAVSSLLDHGADIDFRHADNQRTSAIDFCVMHPVADGDMLDILITRGASLVKENGTTIVHRASELFSKVNGRHILKHILEHSRVRALINSSCGSIRPIHIACFQGNLDAINILLDEGAEVNLDESFNPISMIESVAKTPQDLEAAWTHSPFDLSRWKRIAEIVMLRLLDQTDPGHGRTRLHIAASFGNFERVVQLVNEGAGPWKGDREKRTPLAFLPPEAHEPDAEVFDPRIEDYVEECRKIREFLMIQGLERNAQVLSAENLINPFLKVYPEDVSPSQLEDRYRGQMEKLGNRLGEDHLDTLLVTAKLAETLGNQQRWSEAEKLQLRILEVMEHSLEEDDLNIFKARSDRIRTLIELRRLDEAQDLAEMAFEISRKVFYRTDTAVSRVRPFDYDREAEALKYVKAGKHVLAVAAYDMTRVWISQGRQGTRVELLEEVAEEIGDVEGYLLPVCLQISCDLVAIYCTNDRWEDSRRNVDWLLGSLEFVQENNFPSAYFNVIKAAKVYTEFQKCDEACGIYQKLFEKGVELRGKNSYYSIFALTELSCLHKTQSEYKKASTVQEELVRISKDREGRRTESTQLRMLELSNSYGYQGRWLEASVLQNQILEALQATFGSNDDMTLDIKRVLRKTRQNQNRLEQAEILAREILLSCEMNLGKDDQITMNAMWELASILKALGRLGETVQLRREILRKQETHFGEMHVSTGRAISDLAGACMDANLSEEAETLCTKVISIHRGIHGEEHASTTTCMFYLSTAYEMAGRIEECRDLRKHILEIERKIFDKSHESMFNTMTQLAENYFELKEYEEAILLQREAIAGYRQLQGDYKFKILKATIALACSYHWADRLAEARETYEGAVEGCRAHYGDFHETTINSIDCLMIVYTELDLYEEAKPLALEVYKFKQNLHGVDDVSTQTSLKDVITVFKSLELWASAIHYADILVASLKRSLGEDHTEVTEAEENLADLQAEEDSELEGKISKLTP